MLEKNDLVLYEGKTYIVSEIEKDNVALKEYLFEDEMFKVGKAEKKVKNSDEHIKLTRIELKARIIQYNSKTAKKV